MFNKISLAIITGIVFLFFGCDSEIADSATITEEEETYSILKIVHASSSTGLVDIDCNTYGSDDSYYLLVEDAAYQNSYGPGEFYSGDRTFRVTRDGTTIVATEQTINLAEDLNYTILLVDYNATLSPTFLIVEDTLDLPPDESSFLRFIHASTDAPLMNIEANNGQKIEDLDLYGTSHYLRMDEGTYAFTITDVASGGILLTTQYMTLLGGVNYTIVLSGSIDNMTDVELNAFIIQDTSIQ